MSDQAAVDFFKKLLALTDVLMGPQGCPWDREQTLLSMRASVLEEACEVIEAIDEEHDDHLIEELGDLLYNVVFFCKLAEKDGRFQTLHPLSAICEKLVRRHPHVFDGKQLEESAENQWERIKQEEKKERESLMDGIPKGLPALSRAFKIAGKMERADYDFFMEDELFESEEDLGKLLWLVVREAKRQEINPELALRKEMLNQEKTFREWEKTSDH